MASIGLSIKTYLNGLTRGWIDANNTSKINNQPVRLVGDLYHIINIKRVNGTSRMIATIKKIGLAEGKYEPIEVDIEYLERA